MNKRNSKPDKFTFFSLVFTLVFLGTGHGQTFQKIATPQNVAGSGIRLEFVEPGNLLVAGISPGNISSPFFQMVDMDGNILWTKKLVGFPSLPNVINGLATLPDNSIVASIPFYDQQNLVARQLVLKAEPSSNTIEWATQIGEISSFFYGSRLTIASELEILTAHWSNNIQKNISLTKLSLTGDIDWSYTYSVSSNHISHPSSLALTNDDDYLVSGWLINEVQETHYGILMWLGPSGEVIKSQTYQGILLLHAESYPDGDLLISGRLLNDNNADQSEAFIALTDGDGEIYWAKKIKIEGIFSTCKALVTNDGGSIVFLQKMFSENNYGIIIKLDSQGNIQWQRRQLGNTDISGNLTGVVAGNSGYANISLSEDSFHNTILLRTDLSGNVDGCPAIETCLKLEDISINTIGVDWERETLVNSSIPLNLSLTDMEVNYVDYCENPVPPLSDFWLPDTICAEACTMAENLQQQTADAWRWSGTDIESPNAQDPGEICFPETGATQIQQITYFGGCADTFQQDIEVIPLPNSGIKPDTTICTGSSLILDATAPNAISYEWENGHGLPVREIQQSGNYAVTTDNGFCTSVDSINVLFVSDFFNVDEIDLGGDTILCKDNDLQFGFEQEMVDEFWWNDGHSVSPRAINAPGTYTLSALVEGCLFSDSVAIGIENCGEAIYLPSAFSLNGDGTNDVFTAYGLHQVVNSLQVFNRWGGMVWDVKGDVPWDGTFKGKPAQAGVYVYLLRYTDTRTGEAKMKGGEVVLVR